MKLFLILFFPILGFAQTKTIHLEPKPLPAFKVKDSSVLNFSNTQIYFQALPDNLKKFYLLINYARINPKVFYDSIAAPILQIYPQFKGQYSETLKSDLYNQVKLPLLNLDSRLLLLSNNQANDIVSHNMQPSHTAFNGESFQERMKNAGIVNCAGENICVGQDDVVLSVFLLYLDYQLPELGHRKALMNPLFTQTGLGIAFYRNGQYFIVEDFACRQ